MDTIEFADSLHAEKVRERGEDFRDWANRVAGALMENPADFRPFRNALLDHRLLPAGRVQAAAGSPRKITCFNCFVSGTIEDSFVDGPGSIMQRATEAAATMRLGGGIGYDFSPLRPRGALIRTMGSRSSGPVPFMEIFNSLCHCTSSAGNRRGAQMAVLRVDHPDILEFIRAKREQGRLSGFNLSIAVTDEFMKAMEQNAPFPLRFNNETYATVNPAALWDEIMRATYDYAEPGVIFIDTVNRLNNLWYAETIAATNPCGEQPLPPYGACLLGSICLPRYVRANSLLDYNQLHNDIRLFVRALDRVIDISTYPLPQQEIEARAKRRIGIGVTGLANAGEACAAPYGTTRFLEWQDEVMNFIKCRAYTESAILAQEKGAFPLFDREKYLDGQFIQTLPPAVRDLIAQHGIRNSHLTSIAPTGTISLYAGNVSSGIEPVVSHYIDRRVIREDGQTTAHLVDYGVRCLNHRGRTIEEVSVMDHLAVQGIAQKHVDSAVSKTVNVPTSTPWDDFKDLYKTAWNIGCKGLTTYRDNGHYESVVKPSQPVCSIDPTTNTRSCEMTNRQTRGEMSHRNTHR